MTPPQFNECHNGIEVRAADGTKDCDENRQDGDNAENIDHQPDAAVRTDICCHDAGTDYGKEKESGSDKFGDDLTRCAHVRNHVLRIVKSAIAYRTPANALRS